MKTASVELKNLFAALEAKFVEEGKENSFVLRLRPNKEGFIIMGKEEDSRGIALMDSGVEFYDGTFHYTDDQTDHDKLEDGIIYENTTENMQEIVDMLYEIAIDFQYWREQEDEFEEA